MNEYTVLLDVRIFMCVFERTVADRAFVAEINEYRVIEYYLSILDMRKIPIYKVPVCVLAVIFGQARDSGFVQDKVISERHFSQH